MKIALGMMIRNFVAPEPIDIFLDNAKKYGHDIANVIVVYSGVADETVACALTEKTGIPVSLIKINEAFATEEKLVAMGVSVSSIKKLMRCDIVSNTGLVPYGFNRNNVLIQAILAGADVLFYIDDDVAPHVLKKDSEGHVYEEEIDFFGRHLGFIEQGAKFTTSDYSGYNILPYALFDGMEELLAGLQKEYMLEFWLHAEHHKCLYIQQHEPPIPRRTRKLLGGNLAMDLRNIDGLLPFFSPVYEFDGRIYLARGEDTLIANLAEEAQLECIDIDMLIFHNTYGDYPVVPSLKDREDTQERFFYACTGWIGRNPFMNHLLGNSLDRVRTRQARNLEVGAQALVDYTGNVIFAKLPRAHEAAWDSLQQMIHDHDETMEAWHEFITAIS